MENNIQKLLNEEGLKALIENSILSQSSIDTTQNLKPITLKGKTTIKSGLTIEGPTTTRGLTLDKNTHLTFSEGSGVANNTISLRAKQGGHLEDNSYTGLIAKNYDGQNDGYLVFDNAGIAYVGDEGDLQPLATRDLKEEDNQSLVYWDYNNKTLKGISAAKFDPETENLEVENNLTVNKTLYLPTMSEKTDILTLIDSYSSRITAQGNAIKDETITTVKSITGKSIVCKNLFENDTDKIAEIVFQNKKDGEWINYYYFGYKFILEPGTYTASLADHTTFNGYIYGYIIDKEGKVKYKEDGTAISISLLKGTDVLDQIFTLEDGDYAVWYGGRNNGEIREDNFAEMHRGNAVAEFKKASIQLEKGDQKTDFVPYFDFQHSKINKIKSINSDETKLSGIELSGDAPIELKQWDTINFDEGVIIRRTGTRT